MNYNNFNLQEDDEMKNNSDFMLDNWSPNSMDLLDSIFDTELLNLDEIDLISTQIKSETENNFLFNTTTNSETNTFKNDFTVSAPISCNSSDSGLSSDNLDMDISPDYEPFSPAISSPGPSISERGEKNSPLRNESFRISSTKYIEDLLKLESKEIVKEEDFKSKKMLPKVIVEKIPNVPVKEITINESQSSIIETTNNDNKTNQKKVKIVKLTPQSFNSYNGKKITIQVKNPNILERDIENGEGGKLQGKSGTILINNRGKVTEVKKLIPVQTTTNPRSILLPVTLQDVKGLKTYKVLNMSSLKSYGSSNKNTANFTMKHIPENIQKCKNIKTKVKEETFSEQISDVESIVFEDMKNENIDDFIEECNDDIDIEGNDSNSPYPKLILTTEEKKLLAKEGITLPSHHPLTKYEERELKRIRRKIRNKISAQDSRKRKKEYVDGLEERVKQCTEENQTLLKKIKLLHQQNQNLMSQMKKLQTLLSKGTNKTAHPTTCLLVLLLSLALVATPSLKFSQNEKELELNEATQEAGNSDVIQNRRSLLFDTKDQQNNEVFDEDANMNDFIAMNDIFNSANELLNNCKKNNDTTNEPECKKLKKMIDFDVDEMNWYQSQEIKNMQKQLQNSYYEIAANEYQKNKSQQTSGFNINTTNELFSKENNRNENILKNVIDILESKSINGGSLYDLNIEKIGNIEAVTGHQIDSKIKVSE